MSATTSGIVNFGWLPCTTAKTVYPRDKNGATSPALIASCPENQPPLTTKISPAPLAFALGVNTSIVSAVPNFATVDHVLLAFKGKGRSGQGHRPDS